MLQVLVALAVAVASTLTYCTRTTENPVTGEAQRVALTPEEEGLLGRRSAPELAARMGGLSRNAEAAVRVERVGRRLAAGSLASRAPYRFSFHLLADARTVNAFALPGGPVFITEGLLGRLKTEGELAGVLGHEIGHVIARHASERLAKEDLTRGLLAALAVGTGDAASAQVGRLVGDMINLRYGRDDELEADALGLRIAAEAGYDPRALLRVMEVLAQASGGSRQPEFFATHPAPGNRAARIREQIEKLYPDGVPRRLVP